MTLPSPATLDQYTNGEDWGLKPWRERYKFASLTWPGTLFSLIEQGLDLARRMQEEDVLPRDWKVEAYQEAATLLIPTKNYYVYGQDLWALVSFIEVEDARSWQAKFENVPCDLGDPDFAAVGGALRAAVHMVITALFLAVIRWAVDESSD